MTDQSSAEKWQVRMVRPGLPGLERLSELGLPIHHHPVRPADMDGPLRDAMLARENMLEDVNYIKVVPNRYVVEISPANFSHQFRPIEGQIIQQWREHLLQELVTANSRRGRKEFRFGGRLRIEMRPASDLKDNEARILSQIDPGSSSRSQSQSQRAAPVNPPASARPHVAPPMRSEPARQVAIPSTSPKPPQNTEEGAASGAAYLELVPSGQRWALYPGINTIGRSKANQIYLSLPVVQEKRLVSGQHAYIVVDHETCMIYDGAPDGRPSANGTYVNLRRVPPEGYRLQNGDAIVLAALDPLYPRSDTPGTVTFYFWRERKS